MYTAAAGLVLGLGGAFLGGRAGDQMKKKLKDIANMPGVDTGAVTDEALTDLLASMGKAGEVSAGVSELNQAQLLAREEMALPGLGAAREKALGRISSMFGEDAEWLRGVQRRGAALGLSSGLFGSQAGQLQTLRLGDRESMARTQLGTGLLSSLIGSMRIADSPGAQAFLGPTPTQLIGLRSQERAQKQSILLQRAGVPGQTASWANYLNQTGGLLTGAGAQGMAGSSGGSMPGAGQQNMMMQDWTGMSNMGAAY